MNKFEDSFMSEAKLQWVAAFVNKHPVWSFCEAHNDGLSSGKAVARRMSVTGTGGVQLLVKAPEDASHWDSAEQSSFPSKGKDAPQDIGWKGC